MDGPTHYRQAEGYAEASVYAFQKWGENGEAGDLKAARWQQAQAQLHATLAMTAATADALIPSSREHLWQEVAQ